MSNYYFIPEYDFTDNIFSISPNCGCSGCCKYCYIELNNYKAPKVNECSIYETIKYIRSHSNYSKESVFWVGTWGEVFPQDKELRNNGFLWVELLLELGNPVIILTKAHINQTEMEKLHSWQKYSGQLFLAESISTFHKWKEMEPFTDCPELRIQTLETARKCNIKCGIYICPFLKGITNAEMVEIMEKIKAAGISTVAIQALYMNDLLEEKMQKDRSLSQIVQNHKNTNKTNVSEMKTDRYTVRADDFSEYKKDILEVGNKKHIDICFHFKCMIARVLGIKTKEVSNIPVFCQNCGFCKTNGNKIENM